MPSADPRSWPTVYRRAAVIAVAAVVAVVLAAVFLTRGSSEGGTDGVDTGSAAPVPTPTGTPAERDYAVSPDGDDDADGSTGHPWATLQHALAQLRPGDRLTVADGEYHEDVDVDVHPGTRTQPVQVVAAPGARPVVVGLLWVADLSYWDVRGVNVTWDDHNKSDQHMVKLTDGTGWRFGDAELWGAKSFAALLVDGRPKDFLLSGLYVHDTHPANDTNQDHLIYLNCGTGGGVLERSVLAHSANGRALKIGGADSGDDPVGNITVRYVTMVDNRGPSNVQLAYRTSNVVIEHSLMVGAAEGRANVTAFELKGSGSVVRDSLGWESARLLEDVTGIEDGGGNAFFDPKLTGSKGDEPYHPTEARAAAYGRWAPGS